MDKLDAYVCLMDKMSAERIAIAAQMPVEEVRARRKREGIAAHKPPVKGQDLVPFYGVESDQLLGLLAGVSKQCIGQRRKQAGIESAKSRESRRLDEFNHLLGTMSDPALAALAGCSESAIYKRRTKLGKPPFRQRGKYPRPQELGRNTGMHVDPDEKSRRLADWHETLDGMVTGSLTGWIRSQLADVEAMQAEGLIDAAEARELRELADAAYSHRSEGDAS